MNNGRYILDADGRTPVQCDDLMAWAQQYEARKRGDDPWRVARTEIGNVEVSTVFLSLDHSFGHGPPQLFETMIFGWQDREYCERYSTWEEAEAGHKAAVELVNRQI